MHDRKQNSNLNNTLKTVAWLACGLITAAGAVGCNSYGGSVPLDDDAGIHRTPPGSVDASVPLDDDAGMEKNRSVPTP